MDTLIFTPDGSTGALTDGCVPAVRVCPVAVDSSNLEYWVLGLEESPRTRPLPQAHPLRFQYVTMNS